MDRQNKGDDKKKVSGSGSKARGRGSQSRRGGSSVYQPNYPPQSRRWGAACKEEEELEAEEEAEHERKGKGGKADSQRRNKKRC
ncbi:hypothetical protein HanIR_Chr14g0728461 [Helianthus annuus]|nr:hypothetical protein HanIR_Chr14g0728461 [Helianthus annuus]